LNGLSKKPIAPQRLPWLPSVSAVISILPPPARLYVPDLFFIECTNILWKYVWRFGYSAEAAQQNVADLVRLLLCVAPTADLAEAALALALDRGLTAYDAAYVTLAQKLSLPLVTADEALIRRLGGSGVDVRWLGEWPA
jgi:predicted nucleic acid-binding protein